VVEDVERIAEVVAIVLTLGGNIDADEVAELLGSKLLLVGQ